METKTNLILSGGGIKGIAFIGALHELNQLKYLYDGDILKFKNISATSAGSIIGSLLAIGYKPNEIEEIINNIDFQNLIDDQYGFVRDCYHFLFNYGYAQGNILYDLLGELIFKKTGNADYTLKDLYNEKNIQLVITGTNLNEKKTIYFYHTHINPLYANLPIRLCIRISMSIPFVFQPYYYNDCYFADGGVLDSYPIDCFDGNEPDDPNAKYGNTLPNLKTLGLKITTNAENEKLIINNLYQYSSAYIETFLNENDKKMLLPENKERTIFINTKSYPLSKFDLTFIEKSELIEQGRNAVKAYCGL